MNNVILDKMNKYDADGLDLVLIYEPDIIVKTFTKEQWMNNPQGFPETKYRIWKMKNGEKEYCEDTD